jgi:hypothetical protein
MSKIVKNKDQINATVSPYLKKRCIEISQDPEFTSVSDIVSQALSEFIAKYDERKMKETKKYEDNAAKLLILTLMQTKDGHDFLESFCSSNPKFTLETIESDNSINSELLELVKSKSGSNVVNSSTRKKEKIF